MNVLVAIATLVLLAGVIALVGAPLLAARTAADPREDERAELESARESKYREIRDLELDYRTGKLSREDFDAADRTLRAEALRILDAVEALEQGAGEASPTPPAS